MVWVGSGGDDRTEVNNHNEGVWLPDSSVSNSMTVDFDLLVKNIKVKTVGHYHHGHRGPSVSAVTQYSIRRGINFCHQYTKRSQAEGMHTQTHTHQINLSLLHYSQCVEAVPLTLYANGIVMFQGPFRPFTDPSTQVHCTVQ